MWLQREIIFKIFEEYTIVSQESNSKIYYAKKYQSLTSFESVISFTGGAGHKGSLPKPTSPVGIPALAGIVPGKSLMEMAARGKILCSTT